MIIEGLTLVVSSFSVLPVLVLVVVLLGRSVLLDLLLGGFFFLFLIIVFNIVLILILTIFFFSLNLVIEILIIFDFLIEIFIFLLFLGLRNDGLLGLGSGSGGGLGSGLGLSGGVDLGGLPLLLDVLGGGSLLVGPGIVDLLVLLSEGDGAFPSLDLVLLLDSLSPESGLGHQSLHLGGLVPVGLGVLLALEGPADGVLLDEGAGAGEGLLALGLFDAVEFADAGGSLGAQSSGLGLVGESGNLLVALLDEGEGEGLDVGADDAASDGPSLALSFSLGSVSGGAGGEEEADSVVAEDSLLHGEAVLIESSVDSEDVSLELLAEGIGLNFLPHPLLEEDSASVVIVDIERFGRSVSGVRNAELRNTPLTFIFVTK